MPCSCEQLSKYVKILKYIVTSKNRKDLENKMYKEYPKQVEIAREYAREFLVIILLSEVKPWLE